MKLLKFSFKDEMTELELDIISIKFIHKKLEYQCDKKGSNLLDCVSTWKHDNFEIKCYGFTEGDDTIRNTHVLPTNEEVLPTIQLYGCLFLVAVNRNKIRDLHISEYAMLHYLNEDDYDNYEILSNDDDNHLESTEEENDIEIEPKISITKKVKTSIKTKKNTSYENIIVLELDTHTY